MIKIPKLLMIKSSPIGGIFGFENNKTYFVYFYRIDEKKYPEYKIFSQTRTDISFGISDDIDFISLDNWREPKYLGLRHFNIIEILL